MDRDRLYRGQQNSESAVALNRRATALFSSTNYFPKPPNPSRTERGATADRQPRLFHCHFLPGAVGPCRCRSPPLPFRSGPVNPNETKGVHTMSGKKVFLKFFQGNQPKGAPGRRVVGERGSNDLPPGKKGGETMTPDRHYEHKQHAFEHLP